MRRAKNSQGSSTDSVSTCATKTAGKCNSATNGSSTMRTALGATSPQKIDSATRDRPSSAPVVMTSNVLNSKNGASCCNQPASDGLPSAAAIGPAAMTVASASAPDGIAP